MTLTEGRAAEGCAPVSGLQLYRRSLGEGGTPLVVGQGGFGLADMIGGLLGCPLGAGAVPRAAIQHPDRYAGSPSSRSPAAATGCYPEVLAGMDHVGRGGFAAPEPAGMVDRFMA